MSRRRDSKVDHIFERRHVRDVYKVNFEILLAFTLAISLIHVLMFQVPVLGTLDGDSERDPDGTVEPHWPGLTLDSDPHSPSAQSRCHLTHSILCQ